MIAVLYWTSIDVVYLTKVAVIILSLSIIASTCKYLNTCACLKTCWMLHLAISSIPAYLNPHLLRPHSVCSLPSLSVLIPHSVHDYSFHGIAHIPASPV